MAEEPDSFFFELQDIDYSWPKSLIPERNYERHPTDVSDIAFTQPNYYSRYVKAERFKNGRKIPDRPNDEFPEYDFNIKKIDLQSDHLGISFY